MQKHKGLACQRLEKRTEKVGEEDERAGDARVVGTRIRKGSERPVSKP